MPIQHPDGKLSNEGRKQARMLAKRFSRIPVDIILASDITRAKQTAEIISDAIKKDIVFSHLLREIRVPREIMGKSEKDPEVLRFKQQTKNHADEPEWHYSDEENFFEMKERAGEFLRFLGTRKEENILVVSHGRFIRLIILAMAFGEEFSYKMRASFNEAFRVTNTGITLCEQDSKGRWEIITWNDHAHLG